VHQTVSGARLAHPVNSMRLGKSQGAVAIIHRTVRCASRSLSQKSAARSAGAMCAQLTVTRPHQTVRCAMGLEVGNGRLHQTRKAITHCSLFDGALDCPVRPWTEGKHSLPNGAQMAPRSLGAIKGSPRRMEHNTKYSLNTLRY
jgi:hypothetical protein